MAKPLTSIYGMFLRVICVAAGMTLAMTASKSSASPQFGNARCHSIFELNKPPERSVSDKNSSETYFAHSPKLFRMLTDRDKRIIRKHLFKGSWADLSEVDKNELLYGSEVANSNFANHGHLSFETKWPSVIESWMNQSRLRKYYLYFLSFTQDQTTPGAEHIFTESSWKSLSRLAAKTFIWLINPTPFHWQANGSRLRAIYMKLQKSHKASLDQALSKSEIQYLADNEMLSDAELYLGMQNSIGLERRVGRRLNRSFNWLTSLFVRSALVASFAAITLTSDFGESKPIGTYLHSLETNTQTVDIILDTSFFPHSAMRIGHTIYNPGQTSITALTVPMYLGNLTSQQLRTIQILRLNLPVEKVNELKEAANKGLWLHYNNRTGFYDCTTVISDWLGQVGIQVPSVINASPSLMFAWLKGQGLLSESLVVDSHFRLDPTFSQSSSIFSTAVSTLSRSIEAKLFTLLFAEVHFNQQRIRAESQLKFSNDVQKLFFEETTQQRTEQLEQEFGSTVSMLRVLTARSARNDLSSDHRDLGVERALRAVESLLVRQIELQKSLDTEDDHTVRSDILISIEAHRRVQEMIEQLQQALLGTMSD